MAGLKYSFLNEICYIAIDNAEAGQSFGATEAADFSKLVKSKNFKTCIGLVWMSADEGLFCSGGNLKLYKAQTQRAQGIKTNRFITSALKLLSELEILTVAVVDGDAFGGGVELLGCFDFVLSTPRSFFGLWQRRIGLTFGWGGGARLEKRLGLKRLVQYALLAQTFSAYEACDLGLVDAILPKTTIKERALSLIQASNKRPKGPFKTIKIWTAVKEQALFEKLWFNKDHRNVLKRF